MIRCSEAYKVTREKCVAIAPCLAQSRLCTVMEQRDLEVCSPGYLARTSGR